MVRSPISPRDDRDRLIVALDLPSVEAARRLVDRLGQTVTFYKLGMELVFAGGLALIPDLAAAGKRVFLDMKLLDIDNTVTGAVRSVSALGVTLTTIHAYPKAMRAAVAGRGTERLGLLGVTVLTSMDDADAAAAGYAAGAGELVRARAADALAAGMDGLVCSPAEAALVRGIVGPDLQIVTPGIRPSGSAGDDQRRTSAPADAIRAGADYLVVGRPVTASADPASAAAAIVGEIERAGRS